MIWLQLLSSQFYWNIIPLPEQKQVTWNAHCCLTSGAITTVLQFNNRQESEWLCNSYAPMHSFVHIYEHSSWSEVSSFPIFLRNINLFFCLPAFNEKLLHWHRQRHLLGTWYTCKSITVVSKPLTLGESQKCLCKKIKHIYYSSCDNEGSDNGGKKQTTYGPKMQFHWFDGKDWFRNFIWDKRKIKKSFMEYINKHTLVCQCKKWLVSLDALK